MNPATVSTTDGEGPSWRVMDFVESCPWKMMEVVGLLLEEIIWSGGFKTSAEVVYGRETGGDEQYTCKPL